MKEEEFTYNPVKRLNTAIVNTLDEKSFPSPILNILSFIFYIAAAVFFAISDIRIGAILLFIGGIFGFINSQIQKKKNNLPADYYLVSVIERYSDIFIFFGFIYRYVRMGELMISLVATLGLVGCILLSYTGLRKELTDKKDSIGFMRRTERIAIIIIGAFLNHIVTALYIIAILSNLDALIRIFYIYRVLKNKPAKS
jgi:hypothetical protein